MEVRFKTKKLTRLCNDFRRSVTEWGPSTAQRLQERLTDLEAAANLREVYNLPGRLEALRGHRQGEYSLRLNKGMRLVFHPVLSTDSNGVDEADHDPIDEVTVTRIEILEVVDYHDG